MLSNPFRGAPISLAGLSARTPRAAFCSRVLDTPAGRSHRAVNVTTVKIHPGAEIGDVVSYQLRKGLWCWVGGFVLAAMRGQRLRSAGNEAKASGQLYKAACEDIS